MKTIKLFLNVCITFFGIGTIYCQNQYLTRSSPDIDTNLGSTSKDLLQMDLSDIFRLNHGFIVNVFSANGDNIITSDIKLSLGLLDNNLEKLNRDDIYIDNGNEIQFRSSTEKDINGVLDRILTNPKNKLSGGGPYKKTDAEDPGIGHKVKFTISTDINTFSNTKKIQIKGAGTFLAKNLFKPARFMVPDDILIAAHRGFWRSEWAPEMTLSAFKEALREKFSVLEIDFRRIVTDNPKIEEVVLYHDQGLSKRTALPPGPIRHFDSDGTFRGIKYSAFHNTPIKNRFGFVVETDSDRKSVV